LFAGLTYQADTTIIKTLVTSQFAKLVRETWHFIESFTNSNAAPFHQASSNYLYELQKMILQTIINCGIADYETASIISRQTLISVSNSIDDTNDCRSQDEPEIAFSSFKSHVIDPATCTLVQRLYSATSSTIKHRSLLFSALGSLCCSPSIAISLLQSVRSDLWLRLSRARQDDNIQLQISILQLLLSCSCHSVCSKVLVGQLLPCYMSTLISTILSSDKTVKILSIQLLNALSQNSVQIKIAISQSDKFIHLCNIELQHLLHFQDNDINIQMDDLWINTFLHCILELCHQCTEARAKLLSPGLKKRWAIIKMFNENRNTLLNRTITAIKPTISRLESYWYLFEKILTN